MPPAYPDPEQQKPAYFWTLGGMFLDYLESLLIEILRIRGKNKTLNCNFKSGCINSLNMKDNRIYGS